MNNVVNIENLRVDLGSYFLRGQAIDFWGKALRKNTISTKGYINENSTGIRKEMGGETEIERKSEKNRDRKRVAGRRGYCISKDGPTSSTPLLLTFLQQC